MIRIFSRLGDSVTAAMIWLIQFKLAIAERYSSNIDYIRRLREDERRWELEKFKAENARRFA